MTTKELYTKGARVWIPHPQKVWESATVTADYRSGVLIVKLDQSGDIQQIKVTDDQSLPPLRNPSLLIGQNDLTSLSYLHEPAVLHNLNVRFCDRNAIYTYCGIVLVAINPYYDLPIYGDETIMAYRGQAMGDLDPHIFAVAEEAFTQLERERRDQSIIVSGESGAGKTVSAKYAMRYFAAVGGNASETQVERKVLASSPIMEAIGNAKTTRNDNSSRFGKFIEIHFDKTHCISGASMRTYLLEKSRVVYQSVGERNYHIFYQLCAARDSPLLSDLALDDCSNFQYLLQGGDSSIDGVDDVKAFQETRQALSTLGVSDAEQADMFRILAVVLHLGNIDIVDGDPLGADKEDGAYLSDSDPSLLVVCSLLGVARAELARWLTHRRLQSAQEVIVSRVSAERACFARDALAKRIYADLFAWCVRCVNRALDTGAPPHHNIGVLDIYGFETFEVNSFEQFCINYANEKLQQQFNSHVFKLEQDEYIKEEITWTMIHFHDNQPCIELIEARLGVLAFLDEECRVPQGSDRGFVDKLRDKCRVYPHFVVPLRRHSAFIIKHFADDVAYESGGFLEKNRDTVSEEQLDCIRSGAACRLMAELGAEEAARGAAHSTLPLPGRRRTTPAVPLHSLTQPARRSSGQKQTVGAQFRASLSALMATLSATTPHYVRCIKPNDTKTPFQYDSARAVQQLRACGVLETIRISAAGFPSRWLYQDFFQRYRLLCPSRELDRSDLKATCRRILERNIKDPDKYQFGITKIFFRAGQVAYLEKVRAELQRLYCVRVQSCVRRFLARRRYLRVTRAVLGLQAHARGCLARRRAQEVRRTRAALVLQRHARGWLARRRYRRLRALCVRLQARARGLLARRLYRDRRRMRAAVIIQKTVRGWLARRRVAAIKKKIVICQAAVRRKIARSRYRQLRTVARSLEHVKKLNKGLENKIISLQQRLGVAEQRNKLIEPLQTQLGDLKVKLELYRQLEQEIRALKQSAHDKDNTIGELRAELASERDGGARLRALQGEMEALLAVERSARAHEREESERAAREREAEIEELMRERAKQHEAERRALERELETERSSRQKLLSSQYELQEKYELLNKAPQSKPEHRRSLSDASNNSQLETTVEDDYGYGSVRSVETSRPALEAVNWSAGVANGTAPIADAGLVLRMQNRLAALQSELSRAARRTRDLEERLANRTSPQSAAASADRFRVEELEVENTKLRGSLARLSVGGAGDGAPLAHRLEEELQTLRDELDRRREECIQLKSVLSNQTVNLKSLASSSYGQEVDIINEDGELVQAFEAQKHITRQLEDELTAEKKFYSESIREYKSEIERLRAESESQQKLLSGSLGPDGKSASELYAQHEIMRLAADNLALQERIDRLSESCRKYKNQVRLLAAKLKECGIEDVSDLIDNGGAGAAGAALAAGAADGNSSLQAMPTMRRKEREYLGMFEYKMQDEAKIVRKLVVELKPSVATGLLPGLPAYIMFMMLRHMDHVDDEPKMHRFMRDMRLGVKKTLKRRPDSLEYNALWLANMLRLLNNLRQYSGDEMYQHQNTPRQNQQCLRIFDLSQYRQVFSDTAVWIYQGLVNLVERQFERLIIPAILEHEEISGLSAPGAAAASPTAHAHTGPAKLKQELGRLHAALCTFAVDAPLIVAIFKQLFYFVCGYSLNQLLLRKDLCCWAKGLQIRYNISHLETWIKERLSEYGQKNVDDILSVLKPITQAVQLLQARKSMQDVQSTVDMCADLTANQVSKILNIYTPAEDYEIKITREFIQEIQKKMHERAAHSAEKEQQHVLLMDTKVIFAVQFPFNPSPVRLEDIELPEVLGLQDLLVKI